MFWDTNNSSNSINDLLNTEDLTLETLINDPNFLYQYELENSLLINFLQKEENLEKIIDYIIKEPDNYFEVEYRYHYPTLVSSLFSKEFLLKKITSNNKLLDKFFSFLETDSELNPLQASLFCKVALSLYETFDKQIFDYLLQKENFIDNILKHIYSSAITEFICSSIFKISTKSVLDLNSWFNEFGILPKITVILKTSTNLVVHENVSEIILEMIRKNYYEVLVFNNQNLNISKNKYLFIELFSPAFIKELVEIGFNNDALLITLFKILIGYTDRKYIRVVLDYIKKNPITFKSKAIKKSLNYFKILPFIFKEIMPKLNILKQILLNNDFQSYDSSTFGLTEKPFGFLRLKIIIFLANLVSLNSSQFLNEFCNLHLLKIIIDKFFEYENNNILHNEVKIMISYLINLLDGNELIFNLDEECFKYEDDEEEVLKSEDDNLYCFEIATKKSKKILLEIFNQLFVECNLIDRIIESFKLKVTEDGLENNAVPNYTGHLINMAYMLDNNKCLEVIKKFVSPELYQKWTNFINKDSKIEIGYYETLLKSSYKRDTNRLLNYNSLNSESYYEIPIDIKKKLIFEDNLESENPYEKLDENFFLSKLPENELECFPLHEFESEKIICFDEFQDKINAESEVDKKSVTASEDFMKSTSHKNDFKNDSIVNSSNLILGDSYKKILHDFFAKSNLNSDDEED